MSGNPAGRPRTKPITDALKYALAQPFPNDPQGRTYAELIAQAALVKALKGSIDHLKEIGDRVEGRAVQALEHTGRDGGPIDIASLTPDQRDKELAQLAAELGYVRSE